MKREEIKELVGRTLDDIGCPRSNMNVKIVPSKIRIEVAVRGERLVLECNAGLPEAELRGKLRDLEKKYFDVRDQVDLEEAIEARLPA